MADAIVTCIACGNDPADDEQTREAWADAIAELRDADFENERLRARVAALEAAIEYALEHIECHSWRVEEMFERLMKPKPQDAPTGAAGAS
jgi:uncharacterized membrane protein YccC